MKSPQVFGVTTADITKALNKFGMSYSILLFVIAFDSVVSFPYQLNEVYNSLDYMFFFVKD